MIKKMMRLVLIASVLLAGCKKNEDATCTNVDPAIEDPAIIAYNTSEGISATKHSTGVYYQIINLGTGVSVTASSKVTVRYVGKLLNGTTFDSNMSAAGFQDNLNRLIPGWQIGIPLIRVGGKIRLIIPSAYAYGCQGYPPAIPANSPLFFEITLVGVN